jgi:hypothetical protein
MAMLNAAMATASSIQFWNGTRPSTRNSSTSQSSKEAPGLQFIGNSLFDGHLGCDHNAGDFAASRASDRPRFRECRLEREISSKKHNAAQAEYDRLAALV